MVPIANFLFVIPARFCFVFLSDKSTDEKERDQLRYDRHKDREKDRRIARAAPDKRSAI